MGYAAHKTAAEAFAKRKNIEDAGKWHYEVKPARADLYGEHMWQVSAYEVLADGGHSFNHYEYISGE